MELQEIVMIVTLIIILFFIIAIAISDIEKDSKKEVNEEWLWFLPPRR